MSTLGCKYSMESRLKMSLAAKAYFTKSGKSSMKGKHHSKETKEKMSLIALKNGTGKWMTGKKYADGRFAWNKGKKCLKTSWMGGHHSEITKIKISNAHKGKKFSENHKENLSKAKIIFFENGGKNSNWRGGISFEEYPQEFNRKLKELIRKRDGYKCMECQYPQSKFKYKLSIHHIDYNKKNNDPENLITLCHSCHAQTNFSRDDWKQYFNNLKK